MKFPARFWAIALVALYAAALVALTVPLALACFSWGRNAWEPGRGASFYSSLGYWAWIAVAAAGQACLLALPVRALEGRPRARRPLRAAVVASAFLLGFMTVATLASLAVLVLRDDGLKMFTVLGESNARAWTALAIYVLLGWLAWGWLFFRHFREEDPAALSSRITRWLLRGSALQLLVAVPTHVIVRQRGDCCAPLATFWGIAAGLTVMLMAFGPGVLFLYAERRRRLKPPNAG